MRPSDAGVDPDQHASLAVPVSSGPVTRTGRRPEALRDKGTDGLVDIPVRRSRVVAIVDDDEAVRGSVTFALGASDYLVRSYESSARFLDDEWRDLDCLIVDQHMPNCSGLEVLAQLRGRGARLPVLLITGSTSPDLERRAVELGALVLVKPLVEDDLLLFVERAMG